MIYAVYAAIVSIAALMGFVLGAINPEGMDPTLFFVVDLPATPVGMVIFGVSTVGVGLGVLLLLVAFVADRYDDAAV
ncbi:putative membrane protein [Halapricum desulfuricans]|uniref:Putative membrane protein n=1 Tax=Halapricum desulfuricans TaxID=2841257 RepID=A0A897NEU2_9EURY|nr:putative membrane protein [Halapricum desulfuricans]QSG11202.1 putative membrane protein [Halapricum desulfuricans]